MLAGQGTRNSQAQAEPCALLVTPGSKTLAAKFRSHARTSIQHANLHALAVVAGFDLHRRVLGTRLSAFCTRLSRTCSILRGSHSAVVSAPRT